MILSGIAALLSASAAHAETSFFPTDGQDRGQAEVAQLCGAQDAARSLDDRQVHEAIGLTEESVSDSEMARVVAARASRSCGTCGRHSRGAATTAAPD